jgi:hypothetical protein
VEKNRMLKRARHFFMVIELVTCIKDTRAILFDA